MSEESLELRARKAGIPRGLQILRDYANLNEEEKRIEDAAAMESLRKDVEKRSACRKGGHPNAYAMFPGYMVCPDCGMHYKRVLTSDEILREREGLDRVVVI